MAEQGDVFPSRNLPGLSENWGRHVENRIKLGESSELQLSQRVNNGLRANEGQLAVLSEQLNELYDTVNFLDNQIEWVSDENLRTLSHTPAVTTYQEPFPGTDLSITFEAPPSGYFMVDAMARLYVGVSPTGNPPGVLVTADLLSSLSMSINGGVEFFPGLDLELSVTTRDMFTYNRRYVSGKIVLMASPGDMCTLTLRSTASFTLTGSDVGTSQNAEVDIPKIIVTKLK